MEETGTTEAVNTPQGGNRTGKQVQTSLGMVSIELVTATSGTEEEVVGVAVTSDGYNEVVDMPDESTSGDPSYLAVSV